MTKINDLFIGIINQSKIIHLKNDCGYSENLIYMAIELKKEFEQLMEDKNKKLNAVITLLENI